MKPIEVVFILTIVLTIFIFHIDNIKIHELRVAYAQLQYDAVNLGYAEYNKTNGVWQWKPKTD